MISKTGIVPVSYTYASGGGYGQVYQATYPSKTETYGYDGRGNVTQVTVVSNANPGDYITTQASYEASCTTANMAYCNRPRTTTDGLGRVTYYDYGSHGGITKITSPQSPNGVSPEVRTTYSGFNAYHKNSSGVSVASAQTHYLPTLVSSCRTSASCTNGADEVKVQTGYGPQSYGTGNNLLPVAISSGSGDGALTATTTVSYDNVGNPTYVDGPLAGSADTGRTIYNAARQVVGTIGPDPDGGGPLKHRAQRITYGVDGQPTKVETGTTSGQGDWDWANTFQPLEEAVTEYDTYGRPIVARHNAGGSSYGVVQTSYDPTTGFPQCQAVRMNPLAWSSLPGDACTSSTPGSNGPDRISKVTRDTWGRPTDTQSAYGTPDQVNEQTTYDANNGKVATLADGNSNKTTFEYDAFGRVKKTRFPSPGSAGTSSATDYIELTYDKNSNVTSRRLRDGQVINYGYDNLNRLVSKDVPNTVVHEYDVSYSYDLLGRLTQALDSNTHVANFGYDALGRKTSEQSNWTTRYWQYDLAGRNTRLTWGDGFYVTYDYNVTGEMTAVRENGATSGSGVLATYGYDSLGRRASITRGNGTLTSYGYDPVSRLSSLTQDLGGTAYDFTHGFNYNPAGQIASVTRSNDAYAWTSHYNVDRPYSVNGLNQVTAAGSVGMGYDGRGNLNQSGTSSYGYTSENRLATAPGVQMAYDPLGRFHWLNATSWMQYDGDHIIEERTGSVQRRYVWGPGVDEPLVWYEGAGTTDKRWLHADERGSIVAVSDGAGNAIAINRYDEYGIPASGNIGRFQYTGQAWVSELGMYHYKARMYSPTLGRFMQTDPIDYGDGLNLYAYVSNDPTNWNDPTGLDKCKDDETSEDICVYGNKEKPSCGLICSFKNVYYDLFGGDNDIKDAKPDRRKQPQRGELPVLNHESLYYHYNYGKGAAICLTSGQFQNLSSVAKLGPASTRSAPDNAGNYTQQIRTYGTAYGWMFGTATGRFNRSGQMIGFYDRFDLDSKAWGERSAPAEIATFVGASMSTIMTLGGEKPYDVQFPCN